MDLNPLHFAAQRPVTSALVVIGVGALGWFALGQAPAEGTSADMNGVIVGGASPDQVAANTSLLIAQMQSADNRWMADLQARTTLAARALEHQETQWAIDLADRTDTRRLTEALNLQSTQLQLGQAQQQTQQAVAAQENATARQQSRDNRRANRDTQIGAAIATIATVVLIAFGY